MNNNRTLSLVLTSVFAALICVCTLMVQIPIPATGGYANPGDGVLLLAAGLLPLPLSAAAAAVGSMLADVITGYMLYAPATFIIKGLMAMIAFSGFTLLNKKLGDLSSRLLSGAAAEIVMILGYFVFEGFLYGFAPSLANIPANALQGIAGLIMGTVLIKMLKSIR
ncbi:MAG: ECF transporter S component [Clostridia bacterium]|nr:ECF transporter S component [Clostridia bacterium]